MALEFVVKLMDMMSPKLVNVAKAADTAVAQMNKKVTTIGTETEKAMQRAEKATGAVIAKNKELAGSYNGLLAEIKKVNDRIAATNNAAEATFLKNRLKALQMGADRHFGNLNPPAPIIPKYQSGSINDIKAKIDKIRDAANSTNDGKLFKNLTREAKVLEKQLDKLQAKAEGKRSGGLSSMLGGAVKPLLAAASAGAIMSFATSSVKAAMDFGATSKSYEVLAGNATKGRGLANQLNKLQQDTILGPEVFKAGQTLMSFGVTVDKVMPYVKQLGDVSMGNTDKFNALTLAFSQTQSAGRLMGQDLLQYVNAGFNPLQTMSEKWKEFGFKSQMSVGQLRKAMEKGTITSAMVAKSFEIATSKGGKFADMMDTIGQTSFGKMKVLEGQWENFKIQTGNALMPLASSAMEAASGILGWMNISKSVPDTLRSEQGEVGSLVSIIGSLNEKNSLRASYINQLFNKYPDLFSNLNRETVTNLELKKALDGVNESYERRIALASHQLSFDTDKQLLSDSRLEYSRNKGIVDNWKSGKKETAYSLMTYGEKALTSSLSLINGGQLPGFFMNAQLEASEKIQNGEKAFNTDLRQQSVDEKATKLGSLRNYNNFNKWSQSDKKAFLAEKSNMEKVLAGDHDSIGEKSLSYKYDTSKLDNLINKYAPKSNSNTAAEDAAKASAEKALSGQKTITINIARLGGVDRMDMHGAKMSEGFDEWEKKEKEMFLRVVNAAIGLANN